MDAKHTLLKRGHRRFLTSGLVIGVVAICVVLFLIFGAPLILGDESETFVRPIASLPAGITTKPKQSTQSPATQTTTINSSPTTAGSTPAPSTTSTAVPTIAETTAEPTTPATTAVPTTPAPTATRPPLTGVPNELSRWSTFTVPEDWMECIRRNLQLDEHARPLHNVTEMTDAIPLLITPLTGDVRFFPYFICSVDVPVRYHLVIQNERDPETVAVIDELERRFGDTGRLLVVRNRYNRGYSGSMNQGFDWALTQRTMEEVPWVFACGVDTIFDSGLLANLVAVVRNNTRGDAAMLRLLQEEVAMEERLARQGNLSYYEQWAPKGRPLKVLRSGFPGVPPNVRTAPLLPDRVRYMMADENRENGEITPSELKTRFFGNFVASVTPIPYALGTIVFTRLALSTVGGFDENYFPAYMDDIDMRWRQYHFGFSAIFAEDYGSVRRWHHYNAPNLRGGGPFSDPDLDKYGTENNYSRRAFVGYIARAKGLYDKLKHGPRDLNGVWRQAVEKGVYRYMRFNVSRYPADTWVLDETVRECMFRHTYDYVRQTWTRPHDCSYKPDTLVNSGVLGTDQVASYQAMLAAKLYVS